MPAVRRAFDHYFEMADVPRAGAVARLLPIGGQQRRARCGALA